MKFEVDPQIFAYFPGMHLVVALPEPLTNQDPALSVRNYWQQAWKAAGALDLPNAQSHPHIRQWREQFQKIGVSHKKFPTSIEALLRRALKGGDPFAINPLVDFYNGISLKHMVAAGAFDLEELESDIGLRHTRAGDHFTALDQETPLELEPGEVAYTSGSTVLTRHFMWRQSRIGLVRDTSRHIFVISEVPGVAGYEGARGVEQELESGLKELFSVRSQTFILDAEHHRLEF